MHCDELTVRFGILLRTLSRGRPDAPRQVSDLPTLVDRLIPLDLDSDWFQVESGLHDLAQATISILASHTLELSVHQVPHPSSFNNERERGGDGMPSAFGQNGPRLVEEPQELGRLIEALTSAYERFGLPAALEWQGSPES